MSRIKYIVNLLIVMLLLLAVVINRDAKIMGTPINEIECSKKVQKEQLEGERLEAVESVDEEGNRVINSTTLAKDVKGFAGTTPVEVYIDGDKIEKVVFLKNTETPSFQKQVDKSGLAKKWNGMSVEEAVTASFDAVSGATYTSKAIEKNVQRAAQYANNVEPESSSLLNLSWKDIAGLCVLLLGVFSTFSKFCNRYIVNIQMILNVAVLGFWCGSFLSLTTITAWLSNGFNLSMSIVPIAMLAIAVLMPLFNKKGTYCSTHCPMGSAQGLMGLIPVKNWKINPKVFKILTKVRYYLLAVLLFMMWLGVGFDLMNYEVFSAFIIKSASIVVLVMAVLFLILSVFIPRPYCKFVCPTGALITVSQLNIKNNDEV